MRRVNAVISKSRLRSLLAESHTGFRFVFRMVTAIINRRAFIISRQLGVDEKRLGAGLYGLARDHEMLREEIAERINAFINTTHDADDQRRAADAFAKTSGYCCQRLARCLNLEDLIMPILFAQDR